MQWSSILCMSYCLMDSMTREKCKDFLGTVQNGRGVVGSYHFYASLWASCTTPFKGVPIDPILLNWLLTCI